MIFEHSNYRTYLRAVLAERIGINPAYSLRTLAMELGMAHSSLSEILGAKKNLSAGNALRVGRKLELAGAPLDYFLLLVQLESTKDLDLREEILSKISTFNSRRPRDLSVDLFKIISDWYHYPILEMTNLTGFEFSAENIAPRLGITTVEASAAIDRLLRLELLECHPDGSYRKTLSYLVARSEKDEPAIRHFNEQMLKKAMESLTRQNRDERYGGSETFVIAREQLGEAKCVMEEFFTRILKLSETPVPKTDVYHLNVQFFNLTHERKKQ